MANNRFDAKTTFDLGRLLAFLVVTVLATGLLGMLLSAGGFSDRRDYYAVFTDVTGVAKGDEVRIAGVPVGQVREIEVEDADRARVRFSVDSDVTLTENTNIEIRFRNLVGQRYLVLTQGSAGSSTAMSPGSTIGVERTKNALDLNVLFNGFKPLFEALNPEDINQLSFEIVQVLQGEAGNVQSLLATTSSLTNELADRDELIGDVISNLSQVLDTVGRNDEELDQTLTTLQQFITGLNEDRDAILGSLDSVSELTEVTADFLVDARGPLTEDIAELGRLTNLLVQPQNFDTLEESLQIIPIKWTKLGNTATYGAYYNFYLCELLASVDVLGIEIELPPLSTSGLQPPERCTL